MKGQIIPIAYAVMPVNDWGLVHSDITYDVVPFWAGGLFRFSDYPDRFHASMTALHLDLKMTREAIQTAITDMVAASGFCNSYVAMVCSRGVAKIPGSRDPRQCKNYFTQGVCPMRGSFHPRGSNRAPVPVWATSVQTIPDGSLTPAVKTYPGAISHAGCLRPKKINSKRLFYWIRQVMSPKDPYSMSLLSKATL